MALTVGVVLGGLMLAYCATYVLDRSTATSRARSDKNAQKSVDREGSAFVATITPIDYEQDMPEAILILLDRPLTDNEQAALTALKGSAKAKVWTYLKSLGGRIVESTSAASLQDGHQLPAGSRAQPFNLNLNSDRSAGLTINGMTAVKDSCGEPAAKTVIDLPTAGSSTRPGLLWDLSGGQADKPQGPYILDAGEDQGQPYFRKNVVELGNGQSNMAFRVQPEVATQTCKWHIDASYTDTTGSHTQRIPSGTGTITTEAVPKQPIQYFGWVISQGWGCIGQMSQKGCTATKTLERLRPTAGPDPL
ncbi:hypothetical protein ACFU7Y_23335 [Kitasatospora sp. NPDC057542]|uniref:hypothetical protein n=1 Tax=Streptomycetaceae TaxID=2062 RepID=UPI001CCDAE43|nr:hypothetical protein [Streptomyces sp. LS1784]